ncbi:MAG: zinc-ribbon domain-containing protein, partial [Actinomycetota bacterium]
MTVCTQCGYRNGEGDEFCGSCGEFLDWSGAGPAAPPPPVEDDLP